MKKIVVSFLIFITLVLIVSCSSSPVTNNETESQITTNPDVEIDDEIFTVGYLPVNPDDFFNIKVFSLPEDDFRQVIVDYMRKQSDIEWICGDDFSVSEKFENWGISLSFKKGEKYKGIPYADTKVSYSQFQEALVNGTYTSDSSKWEEVYGVQCISSIMNSLQQFCPDVSGTSNVMMPSYKTFEASILGNYKVPEGVNRTEDIMAANTEDEMYEALAQLKKGDIIMTKDDTKGTSHFRVLVEDATIARNAAGKINPGRSSVKTIEQTNMFDATRKDGVKTTWYVDHIYSFKQLRETKYIPLTLDIYSKDKSECELPYIAIDKSISSDLLAKKTTLATVKSNFPLRYVYMDIYNKQGELVNREAVGNMESTYSISLRNYIHAVFDGLESGDYTFVLSAGIAIGDAELAKVDFSYQQ